MIKSIVLKLIAALGYELSPRRRRVSLEGVLLQARQAGLAPQTVFDVGAAHGRFTETCAGIFPQSRYVLVEPLEEFRGDLERVCNMTPNSLHLKAAASASAGEAAINVHPDLVGSSFYLENEDGGVNGVPRMVPTTTLDTVARKEALAAPYLIKADVQGAEMDVLEGARGILTKAEMIILEASFFHFFDGAPLFDEVVAKMKSLGFVAYDIFGITHRPLDGAMAQADIVFVRQDSALRSHHQYATGDQRAELTGKLAP